VDDWHFVWNALLARPERLFVCVGNEEGVELRDDQRTQFSFRRFSAHYRHCFTQSRT